MRNRLKTSLLDDLIMINLNGPDLRTTEMIQLLDRVYTQWISIRARNVKKSHRESRERVIVALNTEDEEELELCEPELEDVHESDEESADVNSVIYVPDPGFVTIPAPDDEGLQALIAQKFRQNRKSIHIAYKFDNGWQTGKWESVSDRVTRADAAEKSVLLHTVKFNKDKRRYPLNLSLTTYGMDGKWCLVVEDDESHDSE